MGAFTDNNGYPEDSFLVYISNQNTMSEGTKQKLEQIKKLCDEYYKEFPTFKKMLPSLFLMGYGACVWDNEIGLEKKEENK